MDQAQTQGQGQMCKCSHHKMTPFLVVLIGGVFILRGLHYFTPDAADILWGVLILCLGFQKLARGMCKCCLKH